MDSALKLLIKGDAEAAEQFVVDAIESEARDFLRSFAETKAIGPVIDSLREDLPADALSAAERALFRLVAGDTAGAIAIVETYGRDKAVELLKEVRANLPVDAIAAATIDKLPPELRKTLDGSVAAWLAGDERTAREHLKEFGEALAQHAYKTTGLKDWVEASTVFDAWQDIPPDAKDVIETAAFSFLSGDERKGREAIKDGLEKLGRGVANKYLDSLAKELGLTAIAGQIPEGMADSLEAAGKKLLSGDLDGALSEVGKGFLRATAEKLIDWSTNDLADAVRKSSPATFAICLAFMETR